MRRRTASKDRGGRFRTALTVVALAIAAVVFFTQVNRHYPVRHWLVWRYAIAWTWTLSFVAACFGFGGAIADRLWDRRPTWRERLLFDLAIGVVAFFALFFAGGLLGVLSPIFSVALAAVGIGLGVPRARRWLPRMALHLRAARRRSVGSVSAWHGLALLYGALSIAFVYYSILPAQNAAFDARFYHLAIAQQYAVEGAIRPTVEAWWPAALPHLASVLYAWCFTVPQLDMFGRIIAAAHLEFALFLATLASVGVLVRRLVPGLPARGAWVAVFLFPGIFLYDSGLSIAADHVCAFFAVPIYLAFLRVWRRANWRNGALLGAMGAAAVLTKYQAIYLLAAPAFVLLTRFLWIAFKRRGELRVHAEALGAGLAVGAVVTAPHWLKNWVFYGNPVFPNALRRFSLSGYPPGTDAAYDVWHRWQTHDWAAAGGASDRLADTAEALATFSFAHHDWAPFHGDVPVFGSLFTLSLLVLPFLRRTKRTWGLVLAAHLGLAVWFMTFHQDRYLQILLPWMAAVVAVTVALCWRERAAIRLGIGVLVGLQVIWGGDVHSFSAHQLTHEPAAMTTTRLLMAGHAEDYQTRFELPGPVFELGRDADLPEGAKVLIHEQHVRLGLWREVVSDKAGWQFRLRYELEPSAASLHATYAKMGVTHIFSYPQIAHGVDSMGADLRFHDFVFHDGKTLSTHAEFDLLEIGPNAPDATVRDRVAYLGCGDVYQPGLHLLAAMNVREGQGERVKALRPADEPLGDRTVSELLVAADFAVTDPEACPVPLLAMRRFSKIAVRRGEDLWARRRKRVDHAEVDVRSLLLGPKPAGSSRPSAER
jgi:Dolichyl-phosphate-mannose-protein mannosyltransferase